MPWVLLFLIAISSVWARDGAMIYAEHCASCHGDQGEGVAGEYEETLTGKKSLKALAKYIHKTMPEDNEDAVVDEDSLAVAKYIQEAFYSPEAQARLNPIRKSLLRRTQHQHRHALADLVADFRWRPFFKKESGLTTRYFNKEKMNNRKQELLVRTEPTISFDLTTEDIKDLTPEGFSIFWQGSLIPPETGIYHFRVRTPNGARLWINALENKSLPLIDAWVSSANQMRESSAQIFLLGGHAVPIRLDYISFKEKKSSIVLEWKPPHGTWEKIPQRQLNPAHSPQVAIVSTPFPPDDASLGYERGATISKAWKESVTQAALELTDQILGDLLQLAEVKKNDADAAKKIEAFCTTFAERAFGRPLSEKQRQTYIKEHFLTHPKRPEKAAKTSLLLTLTSPYFLYPELNRNAEGQADAYTYISRLALTLWDSLPDPQLIDAAKHDYFKHEENFQSHLDRMLKDPRAKHKMKRFFFHWLHLAEKSELNKDSKIFPDFNEQIVADLRASFSDFCESILWSEPSDYRQLFLSQNVPLSPRLKKFYPKPQFSAGLFTHPYVLSTFSYHRQTSPIHRGVYLSRNVLGRFLKPPPEAIAFKDSDFHPHLTMREKVTELTKATSCMTCHSIINPIGFGLENYDAVGRFRTHEGKKPINTVSQYPTPTDEIVEIKGPKDLAHQALYSPEAHQAFIKHLFHHLAQQPVNAYGSNKMRQLHEQFKSKQFHIQKLMREIARTSLQN